MAADVPFSGSTTVGRPIMEVFEYTSDPECIPEWYPFQSTVEEVSYSGTDSLTYIMAFKFGSVSYPRLKVERTASIPGRRLSYRCLELGAIFEIRFEPSSRGTVVSIEISLWSWQAYLFGLSAILVRPLFNEWIAQSLLSLKRNAEGRNVQSVPVVFFSYRRTGAMYTGGRIYDALCQEFGQGFVYRDINSIPGASKWHDHIEKGLANCKIVIAHIDDNWEEEIEDRVKRGKIDVLRQELEIAIKNKKEIVPIFTSSKRDFSIVQRIKDISEALTEAAPDIKSAIIDWQGLLVRSDPDFQGDLERLIQTIWGVVRESPADARSKQYKARHR